MYEILIVTQNKEALADFAQSLKASKVDLVWANSGALAMEAVKTRKTDLVVIDRNIADMAPLELIARLIVINAMINTALISDLSPHEFHEATEGLGILAQLPPEPGPDQAEKLLDRLKSIMGAV
jgi:CheY-like chemotaxis protein